MNDGERQADLESVDPDARLGAVAVMAHRGSLERDEIERLVGCLVDGDKRVQRRAAEVLAAVGEAAPELDRLLAQALGSPDRRARWGAAYCQSLRGRDSLASIEVWVEHLSAEDSDLRWAAHALLVQHAPRLGPAAIALVRAAVAAPDAQRRKMALYCLRDIRPRADSSEELARLAINDPDVDVRLAAVAAYPVLATDPDRAAPALCACLGDTDPGVQRAAAVALGKLGSAGPQVLVALEESARSSDSGLQRAARGALARLANGS